MQRLKRKIILVDGIEHLKCARCSEVKSIESFAKLLNKPPIYREYNCIPCTKIIRKEYRSKNNWWLNSKDRDRWFIRAYGITLEDYKKLAIEQRHLCAICEKECVSYQCGTRTIKRFHIDHCHTTKKVRGLLCFNCNVGLGSFKDNPRLLTIAIQYLEKTNDII